MRDSTGFALANPGEEYLILQPGETADPFTVRLEPGTYRVEWFSVKTREAEGDKQVSVEDVADSKFMTPFEESGPAVLYLQRERS